MGPWPDGSRRFKRLLSESPLVYRYYLFSADGERYVTDSTGRVLRPSILHLDTIFTLHLNVVELYPPDLAVSEGL